MSEESAATAVVPGINGPRGPYRAGIDRRREILDAAKKVFANAGYRNGSIRDIAKELGASPGLVIHHFGSKEQLLVAILEDRDETTEESFAAAVREGRLLDELKKIVRANERDRGLTTFYVTLAAEAVNPAHPAHDYFVSRYERILNFLEDGIEQEQKRGILPNAVSAGVLARTIIGAMDGLQLQWLLHPSRSMIDSFEESLQALGLTAT